MVLQEELALLMESVKAAIPFKDQPWGGRSCLTAGPGFLFLCTQLSWSPQTLSPTLSTPHLEVWGGFKPPLLLCGDSGLFG